MMILAIIEHQSMIGNSIQGAVYQTLTNKRYHPHLPYCVTLLAIKWIVGKSLKPGKRLPGKSRFPHLLHKTVDPCHASYRSLQPQLLLPYLAIGRLQEGNFEDAMSNLEQLQADYAMYLRNKYFSGKDIEGEEIFQEVAKIGGMTIKGSRFPPTSSYEDPVAYRNAVTASRAEAEKNLRANIVNKENRRPTLNYHVEPAGNEVEPLGVQDESDDSSNSLQEISVDAWNEVQSAIKQAKSGEGPSYRRP